MSWMVKQHTNNILRYGIAVLTHWSSILLCCQVGDRPSMSQTSNPPNQATSASTRSLTRSRYPQFKAACRRPIHGCHPLTPPTICHWRYATRKYCLSIPSWSRMMALPLGSRDISSRIAKAASAMCRIFNSFANTASVKAPRSTCIAPWLSPFCFMALKHGPSPSPIAAA